MSSLVRRFLKLLFRLGIYSKHYVIEYAGPIVSTNKFYASPHWSVRSKLKNKYIEIFTQLLLKNKINKFDELSLVVFCNTRLDIDNHACQNKFLLDTIKLKYVDGDDTRYFISTHTIHDPHMKKNTIEYHLLCR